VFGDVAGWRALADIAVSESLARTLREPEVPVGALGDVTRAAVIRRDAGLLQRSDRCGIGDRDEQHDEPGYRKDQAQTFLWSQHRSSSWVIQSRWVIPITSTGFPSGNSRWLRGSSIF